MHLFCTKKTLHRAKKHVACLIVHGRSIFGRHHSFLVSHFIYSPLCFSPFVSLAFLSMKNAAMCSVHVCRGVIQMVYAVRSSNTSDIRRCGIKIECTYCCAHVGMHGAHMRKQQSAQLNRNTWLDHRHHRSACIKCVASYEYGEEKETLANRANGAFTAHTDLCVRWTGPNQHQIKFNEKWICLQIRCDNVQNYSRCFSFLPFVSHRIDFL